MNEYMPLVSVIVPVYNVRKYLGKCIESIVRQQYSNIEIILVDDGSTDGSSQICDDYGKTDRRIRIIHKENGGLSDARNRGIDLCIGEYILFVDSDDYIHPYMIKGMLDTAVDEKADIVECGIQNVDECCRVNLCMEELPRNKKILNHDQAVENILDYGSRIVAWNKLYRRELFDELRFPTGKVHEDEYLVPFLVDQCSRYVLIENKYYMYLQRSNSIMGAPFFERRLDIIEAQQERLAFFSKKYHKKYDGIIKYHFFSACAVLKGMMKEQFYGSDVQGIYRMLFREVLVSKNITIKKKIKVLAYRFMKPKILRKIRNAREK